MNVKKPSLIREFDYIYSKDPALDVEHEDFDHDKYKETGDLKYLPLKEGIQPAIFGLRPLNSKEQTWIAEENIQNLIWKTVATGLVNVKNLYVDDKEHNVIRVKDGSVFRADDGSMDIIFSVDEMKLVIELFAAISGGGPLDRKSPKE